MDREYFGIFMDKSKEGVFKQDCRVVLENDKISLYFLGKYDVKFREFRAESIFSFENERLIRISKRVNLSLEVLTTLIGTFLLVFNWFIGLAVIGLSFLSVLRKPSKSYILLCKPVAHKSAVLRLLKVSGIKSYSQKVGFNAA